VSPGNPDSCFTSSASEKRLFLDRTDTRLGSVYNEALCNSRLSTGTVGLRPLSDTAGLPLYTDWSTNLGTLKFSIAIKDTSCLDCCAQVGFAEVSGGLHDDAACPSSTGVESGALQGTPCRLDGDSSDQKLSRVGRRNDDVPVLCRASPDVPDQPTETNSVSVSPSNKTTSCRWRGSWQAIFVLLREAQNVVIEWITQQSCVLEVPHSSLCTGIRQHDWRFPWVSPAPVDKFRENYGNPISFHILSYSLTIPIYGTVWVTDMSVSESYWKVHFISHLFFFHS
jgi:hypothetical protein